jgi:hypothetical protein
MLERADDGDLRAFFTRTLGDGTASCRDLRL